MGIPFDLHMLSKPPTFILSQRIELSIWFIVALVIAFKVLEVDYPTKYIPRT